MSKYILYADDEPWFIEALFDALRDAGYTLEQVSNGTEVIKYLQNAKTLPDLIILDVIMPTGDDVPETDGGRRTGVKVHEMIRKELHITKIPIILLTVVDDASVERSIENVERSLGIKKCAVLVKPVLPTELIEKIESMLMFRG